MNASVSDLAGHRPIGHYLPLILRRLKTPARETDDAVIQQALSILERRLRGEIPPLTINQASSAKAYLKLQLAERDREVFAVLLLNTRRQLIRYEEVFLGSLTNLSVYPSEIAKLALKYNAQGVVLSHNHPSGSTEPSQRDIDTTKEVTAALNVIGVQMLDHIVVGQGEPVSMGERGLI